MLIRASHLFAFVRNMEGSGLEAKANLFIVKVRANKINCILGIFNNRKFCEVK